MPVKKITKGSTPAKKDVPKKSVPKAVPKNGSIDKIIADINSKHGANAVMLGVPENQKKIQRVPTGNLTLDVALGGGVPVGRYFQISGGFSVGKTAIGLHMLANFQKQGHTCAFFDVEATSGQKEYLSCFGIDVNNLIYATPDGFEECADIILKLQKEGVIQFALWDCIIITKPNEVRDKESGEGMRMGIMQTMLDVFLARVALNNNRLVREGKVPLTLVALNQLREKPTQYGNPEYSPGGRAKDFYSSINLNLRRAEWLTEGTKSNKVFVGQTIAFKTEKNKTYKRMQEGQVDLYIDDNEAGVPKMNFDNLKSIIVEAVDFGIIKLKGAWYYIEPPIVKTQKSYQGMQALLDDLRDDEKTMQLIYNEVIRVATEDEEE